MVWILSNLALQGYVFSCYCSVSNMLYFSTSGMQFSPCNVLDSYHNFVCPYGQSISRVWGWHDNRREDRIYCYSCQNSGATGSRKSHCYTTGYVNSYDYPVAVQCRPNYYFAGVKSVHYNKAEDRLFDFRCCKSYGKCTKECNLVGPVNGFDGGMDYNLHGKVIIGAFSWHDNHSE